MQKEEEKEKSEEEAEVSPAAIASLAFWPYIKEGQNQLYKQRVWQARHASNAKGETEREERGKKKADSRQTKTQDTEETRDNERQWHQQQQQPKQHRHWQQHRCLLPLPLSPFRSP